MSLGVIKIRKFILSIIIIAVTIFTFSVTLSTADMADTNGIATVFGKCDPNDTIEISLPNTKIIHVIPNNVGDYNIDINGLSIGDTVYATAVSIDGKKSQPTKHTITTADMIEQNTVQDHIIKTSEIHSKVLHVDEKLHLKKEDNPFFWLTVLFGVSGVTAGGATFINSRFPKVERSFFSLVGSGLLWRSQRIRYKVRLVGRFSGLNKNSFLDVTPEELNTLDTNEEVELSQQFTRFEMNVFNRQNNGVKMVPVDE